MRAVQSVPSDVRLQAIFYLLLFFSASDVTACHRNCTCEFEGSALTLKCSRHVPRSVLSIITDTYTEVTLLNIDMKTLDFNAFDQLHHLINFTLRDSSLSKLRGTGRNFLVLESLDLSNNALHSLDDHAFRDFPKLTVLVLSGNHIHSISSVAFSLRHLQALDLSRNSIRQLHSFAFSGMPNLLWVNVSDNGLTHIPNGLFGALHSLETADFSANKIIKVADKALEGINFTRLLNLRKNYLKSIPTKALQDTIYINELILDENEMVTVDAHSLKDIPVRILEMKNMPRLRNIKAQSFVALPYLEGVRVSGCGSLEAIHHQAFLNLSSLVALDISNNALLVLPETIILNTPFLRDIDISGNNFSCHCSLLWTLRNKIITEKPLCWQSGESVALSGLKLTDLCPPFMLRWSDTETVIPIGNNAVLSCEAVSIQPEGITIAWTDPEGSAVHQCNTKKLHSSAPCASGDDLIIHFASEKNGGEYTCNAVDRLNQTSRQRFTLIVQKDAVKLFAIEVTSKSISVSWNPPDIGQKLQSGFFIETTDVESDTGVGVRIFEKTYSSHVCKLNGLSPNRLYNLSLIVSEGEEKLILSSIQVRTPNTTNEDASQRLRHSHLLLGIACGSLALAMLITCLCFARILHTSFKKKDKVLPHTKSTDSNIYLINEDKYANRVSPSYSFQEISEHDGIYTDIHISDLDKSPLVV